MLSILWAFAHAVLAPGRLYFHRCLLKSYPLLEFQLKCLLYGAFTDHQLLSPELPLNSHMFSAELVLIYMRDYPIPSTVSCTHNKF